MSKYAPVLIITLCRYEHFKKCVESLSSCTHALETELYIALDFPSLDSHQDGYKMILKFINEINGFKMVHLIKRDVNYGAVKNFVDATKMIFREHDRYIFSEDDNYFSPNFLDYINKGLDKYEDRKDVFAINGYNYPIAMPDNYKNNIYLWKGLSAWGFGIWKDRWVDLDNDFETKKCLEIINSFLSERENIHKLNKYASHYFPALLKMVHKKCIFADALISTYIIKNDFVCIFPSLSKVRNYGHDGSGLNCGSTAKKIYSNQEVDINKNFEFGDFVETENSAIYKILKTHFKRSKKSTIKTWILYFLYKLRYPRLENLKNKTK